MLRVHKVAMTSSTFSAALSSQLGLIETINNTDFMHSEADRQTGVMEINRALLDVGHTVGLGQDMAAPALGRALGRGSKAYMRIRHVKWTWATAGLVSLTICVLWA